MHRGLLPLLGFWVDILIFKIKEIWELQVMVSLYGLEGLGFTACGGLLMDWGLGFRIYLLFRL